MIVELVGLPGAGKTTVMRESIRFLQEEMSLECATREALLARWKQDAGVRMRVIRELLRTEPRVLSAATSYVSGIRPWSMGRWKYWRVLLFTSYAIRRLAEEDVDVVFLDHSILQAAYSAALFARLPSETRLRSALRSMYGSTSERLAFIYFHVDPAVSADRIAARSAGWSRFDAMDADDARAALAGSLDLHHRLFSTALSVTGASSIHIDAGRPVAEITRAVVALVRDRLAKMHTSGSG